MHIGGRLLGKQHIHVTHRSATHLDHEKFNLRFWVLKLSQYSSNVKSHLQKKKLLRSVSNFKESCYDHNSVRMATSMTTAGILLPDWLKYWKLLSKQSCFHSNFQYNGAQFLRISCRLFHFELCVFSIWFGWVWTKTACASLCAVSTSPAYNGTNLPHKVEFKWCIPNNLKNLIWNWISYEEQWPRKCIDFSFSPFLDAFSCFGEIYMDITHLPCHHIDRWHSKQM